MSDCAIPSIRLLSLETSSTGMGLRRAGLGLADRSLRIVVPTSGSLSPLGDDRFPLLASIEGNAPVLIRGAVSAAEVSRHGVTGSLPMLRYCYHHRGLLLPPVQAVKIVW
jgi:hypothetical protein